MTKQRAPSDGVVQPDLFEIDTGWFHVMREMFHGGDVARMGSSAFALYCALKCRANHQSGNARVSLAALAEYLGVTTRTVQTLLKRLENLNYVTTEFRLGRKSVYQIRERFRICRDGQVVTSTSMPYVPGRIKELTDALRRLAQNGLERHPHMHIDNLAVVVQVVQGDLVIHSAVPVDNREPTKTATSTHEVGFQG